MFLDHLTTSDRPMLKYRLNHEATAKGRSGIGTTKAVPLYEYRCNDCQQVTSVLVRIPSANKQPICEHCQSAKMEKLISKFSFKASWGDSLNWAPSRETTSDVDDSSGASIDKYMGRIKKEMGGQTTSDFNRERRDMKNS